MIYKTIMNLFCLLLTADLVVFFIQILSANKRVENKNGLTGPMLGPSCRLIWIKCLPPNLAPGRDYLLHVFMIWA